MVKTKIRKTKDPGKLGLGMGLGMIILFVFGFSFFGISYLISDFDETAEIPPINVDSEISSIIVDFEIGALNEYDYNYGSWDSSQQYEIRNYTINPNYVIFDLEFKLEVETLFPDQYGDPNFVSMGETYWAGYCYFACWSEGGLSVAPKIMVPTVSLNETDLELFDWTGGELTYEFAGNMVYITKIFHFIFENSIETIVPPETTTSS